MSEDSNLGPYELQTRALTTRPTEHDIRKNPKEYYKFKS